MLEALIVTAYVLIGIGAVVGLLLIIHYVPVVAVAALPIIGVYTVYLAIAGFNGGGPNLMGNSPQEIANPNRGHVVAAPVAPPVAKTKAKAKVANHRPTTKKCSSSNGCDAAGKTLPKFLAQYKQNGLK